MVRVGFGIGADNKNHRPVRLEQNSSGHDAAPTLARDRCCAYQILSRPHWPAVILTLTLTLPAVPTV